MAIPAELALNVQRIRKLMKDLSIQEADAARLAKMSINTVKDNLAGDSNKGSASSVLRLERALEMERRRREAIMSAGAGDADLPGEFEEQLALALTLSTSLSQLLHAMTLSAPAMDQPISHAQAVSLSRNLRTAQSSLEVLT